MNQLLRFIAVSAVSIGLVAAAQAHSLVPIKKAQGAALEQFRKSSISISDGDLIVAAAYRVMKVSPKRPGEPARATAERIIKAALHRDYPITGDDGGYRFRAYQGQITEQQLRTELFYLDFLGGSDEGILRSLITNAIKGGMLVYIGSGAGNNTIAQIIVAVDLDKKEFVYLMASNFGRDS